jgi:hypothetical protein
VRTRKEGGKRKARERESKEKPEEFGKDIGHREVLKFPQTHNDQAGDVGAIQTVNVQRQIVAVDQNLDKRERRERTDNRENRENRYQDEFTSQA